MNASELFKEGRLTQAIEAQIAAVKASPADASKRLFLFELLVFDGDLDRARRQIDAIRYDKPELDAAVDEYRRLLDAEKLRRQVFESKVQPEFFLPPPEHVRTRLLGLVKLAGAAQSEAAELFQQANAQAARTRGTLDGRDFEDLRDGDDVLGQTLEVMAHGRCYWVAIEQIQRLTMNAPRFPRDLVWIPAGLELGDGSAGQVFLPSLYAGTEREADSQLKLARQTEWRGETLVRGVGVKTFFAGQEETGILDWRKLELASAPETSSQAKDPSS